MRLLALAHGRAETLAVGPRSLTKPSSFIRPVPLGPSCFLRAEFASNLTVVLDTKTNRWILAKPLTYHSRVLSAAVTVPAGFDTDFASVPRFPPLAFALTGDTSHAAAVVHDYLYRFHQASRRDSDAVLFEAMAAEGEPGWRECLMWLGVRAGGWRSYHANDALAASCAS